MFRECDYNLTTECSLHQGYRANIRGWRPVSHFKSKRYNVWIKNKVLLTASRGPTISPAAQTVKLSVPGIIVAGEKLQDTWELVELELSE